MDLDKHLIKILEDPKIFHYKKEWIHETDLLSRTILELFTFGSIKEVTTDIRIYFTDLMVVKLQKLTLISLLSSNNKREISYGYLLVGCQLNDDVDMLEEYLLSLSSQGFFKIKLDPIESTVKIINYLETRDVYCNERELLIIEKNSLITKPKLINELKNWKLKLQNKISE